MLFYFCNSFLARRGRKVCSYQQGNPTEGEGSTIDLIVLTSLEQLLFIMQTSFTFYKTNYLKEDAQSRGHATLAHMTIARTTI
jgi:hypothetical protein